MRRRAWCLHSLLSAGGADAPGGGVGAGASAIALVTEFVSIEM
jgi:hypothetical protein